MARVPAKEAFMMNYSYDRLQYLKLLRRQYPTVRQASAEIIRLKAILNLPKGTEHFLSDLHGEHAAFLHMLRNASGVIKEKITGLYRDVLPTHDRDMLCTLVYYPEEKLSLLKKQGAVSGEWYRINILRLVEIARTMGVKYTRAHVRAAMPSDLGELLEELLLRDDVHDKERYYSEMVDAIIECGQADAVIIELSKVIQYLSIDRLHIIGDIYDRGPRADLIMDALMDYHSVDVQWGNHDIVWMGAAAGSQACIAQVLVTQVKYGNLDALEVGYGISLRALATFAAGVYAGDPCTEFLPKQVEGKEADEDVMELARMHKAAAIILFKLEGQLLRRHPEYGMSERMLLERIDFGRGAIWLDGVEHPLRSCRFPTIDPADPYELTEGERDLMERLQTAFEHSDKLQRHVKFLFSAGSMYLKCNGNLLYHGCIPMNADGTMMELPLEAEGGARPCGRYAVDCAERLARQGYFARQGTRARADGQDFMWYLWCGPASPLFGKSRMTTFERYFVADEETWHEYKNPYYSLMDDEQVARRILSDFDLDPDIGCIINGHVPVRLKKGESPIRAGGRLLVIDGGLSRAYQGVTGIAGYTLIFSSHALLLVAHQPFESTTRAITDEQDIHSVQTVVRQMPRRLRIADTDQGVRLRGKIDDLSGLIDAFASGAIKEGRHDERED